MITLFLSRRFGKWAIRVIATPFTRAPASKLGRRRDPAERTGRRSAGDDQGFTSRAKF